jgi:hypothetical protein
MFKSGRVWMWIWIAGVGGGITIQTVCLALAGELDSNWAISLMSIEGLYGMVGAGFQASLSMRKADPKDPL